MRPISLHAASLALALLFTVSAFAGTLKITSPAAGASYSGAVPVTASASETTAFHLELWDNGAKLGNVFASSVNAQYPLATGAHTTTILAVSTGGVVLSSSAVSYKVTAPSTTGGNVTITSPTPNSTSINAVRITAAANQPAASMLQIWDNGTKLGNVFAPTVNNVIVLPSGSHVLTVESVAASGALLSKASVNYTVASPCTTSANVQCNLDQIPVDTAQNQCNPAEEVRWVGNPCGGGVQGTGGSNPLSTGLDLISESTSLPNLGNLSLDGHSLHLSEVQGNGGYSNVLFRGQSPTATTTDSHWTMDEYVYLPDPTAHQAFEMDAQASMGGIWTKFYTECAFDMNAGTGYWAVFDTNTGGWIFLNGKTQNGETPPTVPCNRAQFAQPWSGSSDPSFTGWHHIAWSFLRNSDGTVTFQSLTFDGTTTEVNFKPRSASGGPVNNTGKFSALIQLDGVLNQDRKHDLVDVYLSQITLTHTP